MAEMGRSDEVRVLGPHLDNPRLRTGTDLERMVIVARAGSVEAAEDLLWDYMGPQSNYAVSVKLRESLGTL